MSLTTPVPRDVDSVFPGENWFFYWKTSSSLWRAKIEASPETGPVLIPLNWSFHSETGETYDFAQNRPETNLARLVEVVESLGRKAIFLLPLTPAPFLANGGVPHLLSRVMAQDDNKVARMLVGPEGELHKLYSFFDPRVYQSFARFVRKLGEYFTTQGISSDIYGINCGYLGSGQFQSFFKDRSRAFEQGFSRFLKAKIEQGELDEVSSVEQEKQLKDEYYWTILNLYGDVASESLAGNWEGTLEYSFLGSSTTQSINRFFGADVTRDYTREVQSILTRGLIPSSALLPSRVKSGVLKKQLDQQVDQAFIETNIGGQVFEDDESTRFKGLSFFTLFEGQNGSVLGMSWEEMGLINAIFKRHQWCFNLFQGRSFKCDEDYVESESVHFVRGQDIDKSVFNSILKLFMSGGRVIIERSTLSKELEKKFETFFIENALTVEKVNIGASVHNVSLGPGRLLIIEASKIFEQPLKKRVEFWEKILGTFDNLSLEVIPADGIEIAWRTRGSGPSELNYQEVRRLSLYNPTSYKKKMKISLGKHFVLTKVVDESQVKAHSTGQEVEIEFQPEGSISLDIGVFS